MKIKIKITLLFTLLVTIILVLLAVAVYYFSALNRKSEFSERLRNRALTTTRLLLEVEEIDPSLLRKIDSFTMNLLFEENITIYNHKNEILYSNQAEHYDAVQFDSTLLDKIRTNGEYRFTSNDFDGVGVMYRDKFNHYIVLATAIDKSGKKELQELSRIMLFTGLIGMIITLLTGYFFSINLLRPLSGMNREMKEISHQNLSRRIQMNNNKDELGQLATTFNSLLDRLEISFNNQKRFIANASHELSTPLTAISSQLEVALMHNRNDKEYQEVLISVHEDVVHLNELVKKLLELAKAAAGKGISLEPVRVDEILLKAATEVNTLHPDFNVSFTFDEIPEDEALCYVYGNEELLFVAFKNMMENACKYSIEHKAWVTLAIQPGKKNIYIKDKGIGIAGNEIEKIFEPFFRSEKAEQLSEGAGLGLSMAARIIRLHKGEINLHSDPGTGSIFTITLPAI